MKCWFPCVHIHQRWCPQIHVILDQCDIKDKQTKLIQIMELVQLQPRQIVTGNVYNSPHFLDIKYIWLLDFGKKLSIVRNFCSSLESLRYLCSLIDVPTLSWLMCLSNFCLYLQPFQFLYVIVFFLSSWDHDLPIFFSMFESLSIHCCYHILECSDYSPIREIYCTKNRVEKFMIWQKSSCYFPKYLLLY